MRKALLFLLIAITVLSFKIQAQEIAQWRGENRDGKYKESGLLKQWPENGPKLLWHYDNLDPGCLCCCY